VEKKMSDQAIIEKTEQGWIIELPDEFSKNIGVAKNSIGLLEYKNGKIEVEILPPVSDEIRELSARLGVKHKEYFEKMKNIGD
jgi:hypothetical protein